MQILQFFPGALAPADDPLARPAAHMPMASGRGDFELSCLYLAPGGHIAVPPIKQAQLLLFVNGRADADCREPSAQLALSAGTGLLLAAGEHCRLATDTGAIALIVTAERLLADRCGPSLPERVRGQLWPHLESN